MSLDTRGPLTGAAPSHLAAAVLAAGGEPLVKAMGMWLEYVPADNCYRELSNDELKSKLWRALEGRTYPHRTPKGAAEERTLNLTKSSSADVAEALIHLTLEPGVKSLPFWRNGTKEGDPEPHEVGAPDLDPHRAHQPLLAAHVPLAGEGLGGLVADAEEALDVGVPVDART